MAKTSLQNIATYYTDRDLTGDEIQQLVGRPPVLYSDLPKYKFNTLFTKNQPYVVVLLQTKKINFGHYVACFVNDDAIYYYDSYGLGAPDTYRSYTPYDQQFDTLLKNILESDPQQRPIISNTVDMQKWGRAQTCGRWASLRIMYRNLDNNQFHQLFVGNTGFISRPDYLATILTLNGLQDIPQYFAQNRR